MSGTVTQSQSGIRSEALGGDLMQVLTTAAQMANVDVTVFSGGQPSAAEPGERTGSTRHDHGNAADINLYQDGRLLSFTKADDRDTIASFVSAAVAAGATGIGAGLGYMGASGLHVGFGPNGVQGGPVTVWGAGGRTVNAPSWLSAAVAPGAVRGTVMAAQANLRALGYLEGPVDGVLGSKTIAAIGAFIGGTKGIPLSALPSIADVATVPETGRMAPVYATDKPVSLAAAADRVIGQSGNVLKGLTGGAVREVQSFLNQRGVTDRWGQPLKEDAIFGPRTDSAVRAYQAANDLRADGIVGPRTLSAMLEDQRAVNMASPAAGAEGARGLQGYDQNAMVVATTQLAALNGASIGNAIRSTPGNTAPGFLPDGSPGEEAGRGASPAAPAPWSWGGITRSLQANPLSFAPPLVQSVLSSIGDRASPAGGDPYRLGSATSLGRTASTSELAHVTGAIRGATDALAGQLRGLATSAAGALAGPFVNVNAIARSTGLNLNVGQNFGARSSDISPLKYNALDALLGAGYSASRYGTVSATQGVNPAKYAALDALLGSGYSVARYSTGVGQGPYGGQTTEGGSAGGGSQGSAGGAGGGSPASSSSPAGGAAAASGLQGGGSYSWTGGADYSGWGNYF